MITILAWCLIVSVTVNLMFWASWFDNRRDYRIAVRDAKRYKRALKHIQDSTRGYEL